MSHRGNGEGTIYQRKDGLWEAKLVWPTGRRQSFYSRSRSEVATKLAVGVRARDAGQVRPAAKQTVSDALVSWLATTKPAVRSSSWIRYEELVRLHAVPEVGAIPLRALQPEHLQRCYTNRLANGLSPTSVHQLHVVIHAALDQAHQWGRVTRNVADLVNPPRMARPEMRTLSLQQVQQLLATAAGDRSEAIYVLAVTTGMRQGELLGLHWRDVDLDRSVLSVTCALQRVTGQGLVLQEPKTLRSRRQVWLGRTAVEALSRRRTNQLAERLQAGPSWKDTDLVFTTELGGPRDAHDVRLAFDRLLTRAGLPRVRFHDLRHTAATLMLGQGVHPKVAADMLGHATVAVTLDTYSHVTSGMHEAAAEALDRIVRVPS